MNKNLHLKPCTSRGDLFFHKIFSIKMGVFLRVFFCLFVFCFFLLELSLKYEQCEGLLNRERQTCVIKLYVSETSHTYKPKNHKRVFFL